MFANEQLQLLFDSKRLNGSNYLMLSLLKFIAVDPNVDSCTSEVGEGVQCDHCHAKKKLNLYLYIFFLTKKLMAI